MILGRHDLTHSIPLPSFLSQESARAPQVRVPAGDLGSPKPTQTRLFEGSLTKGLFTKVWTSLSKSTRVSAVPRALQWGGGAFPEGIRGGGRYPIWRRRKTELWLTGGCVHLIVAGCLKIKVRSGRGTSYLSTVPTQESTWKKRKK